MQKELKQTSRGREDKLKLQLICLNNRSAGFIKNVRFLPVSITIKQFFCKKFLCFAIYFSF